MVDWLAGKRVRGTSSERPSLGIDLGGTGVGGWVEVGRTTLGGTADTISVSSLSDKRYYMILSDTQRSGRIDNYWRFNGDTGSNYAYRRSIDGAADAEAISSSFIPDSSMTAGGTECFSVSYLANLSSKQKIHILHSTNTQNGTGAGSDPRRFEVVGKWSGSDAIDTVSTNNLDSGDYTSGSEVVVLGWDPSDTHTTNFWQELANVNSAGAEDSFNTGTFTAKKYLWIQIHTEAESGTINPYLRVGNSTLDTGSTYAQRYSTNGGSDATLTSQPWLALDGVTPASGETTFTNIFIINNASQEKLFIIHSVESEASGAGNAPSRIETTCKWVNTSSQINIIGLYNNSGTGDFSSKSQIKVWGAD